MLPCYIIVLYLISHIQGSAVSGQQAAERWLLNSNPLLDAPHMPTIGSSAAWPGACNAPSFQNSFAPEQGQQARKAQDLNCWVVGSQGREEQLPMKRLDLDNREDILRLQPKGHLDSRSNGESRFTFV